MTQNKKDNERNWEMSNAQMYDGTTLHDNKMILNVQLKMKMELVAKLS